MGQLFCDDAYKAMKLFEALEAKIELTEDKAKHLLEIGKFTPKAFAVYERKNQRKRNGKYSFVKLSLKFDCSNQLEMNLEGA